MDGTGIERFRVHVDVSVLEDLTIRLERTRWPTQPDVAPWTYGADLNYMRSLVEHWRAGYDWRRAEARLNAFANFKARIDGLDIHFIMDQGSGANPLPLILTHGWPGSIFEFLDVIEPLAHPERFGGSTDDAFTVIVPSLPGYGFSSAPAKPITPRDIAALWNRLMTTHLRHPTYVAQGGDWGAIVSSWIAFDFADSVRALHLNLCAMNAGPDEGNPLSEEERDWIARSQAHRKSENGYWTMQGTKPQTVAYALTDSPAGLAAWIVEKFQGWTVPGTQSAPPFGYNELIDNVMMYWLPGPNAANQLYVSLLEGMPRRLPDGRRIAVPTGMTLCPMDVSPPPPNSWIERSYNLVHRRDAERGGHFLAMEQGDMFVRVLRDFFREFRR